MKTIRALTVILLSITTALVAADEYQLSTHVLDTSLGKPGQGVRVKLEKKNDAGQWIQAGTATTDQDGRIKTFLKRDAQNSARGIYRLTFQLEEYFAKRGEKTVFPEGVVVFKIEDDSHYHIPLVVTPHAVSTYRGS